jgi:hypothetical protein
VSGIWLSSSHGQKQDNNAPNYRRHHQYVLVLFVVVVVLCVDWEKVAPDEE